MKVWCDWRGWRNVHEGKDATFCSLLSFAFAYTTCCLLQILMQMRHVLSATTGVLRSLTVDEAIGNIVKEMAEAMEAERASVFIIEKETNELWTKTLQGQEIRIPIGSGIAGFVARSGETLHIANAYDDSRFNSLGDSKTGLLCFAIIYFARHMC